MPKKLDPSELWLAVLGITPFLDGGRISVSPSVDSSVQKLLPTIRQQLRLFLRSGGPSPDIPDLDFREVGDALFGPMPGDELALRLSGFPEALVPGIVEGAVRGRNYLQQRFPITRHQTALALEYRDPSPHDAARFARLYSAIDDPLTVFQSLVAGRLSGDQQDAFAAVYPTLYDASWNEVFPALADVFAGKDKPDLPRKKQSQLEVFMGQKLSPDLASVIAESTAALNERKEGGGGGGPDGKIPPLFESGLESAG